MEQTHTIRPQLKMILLWATRLTLKNSLDEKKTPHLLIPLQVIVVMNKTKILVTVALRFNDTQSVS